VCGRTTSTLSRDQFAQLLDVDEVDAPELPISWNVAPTQDIYVAATTSSGSRKLRALRWGLVPHWSKEPRVGFINARAETMVTKPAFRSAVRFRRGVAPLSGFYEWKRPAPELRARTEPFYFQPASPGSALGVAVLYEVWRDAEGRPLRTVAIITTAANETMTPVHHRMPVILSPGDWAEWLAPGPLSAIRLAQLMAPAPDDLLETYPVSPAVNSAKNNGPELIERWQPTLSTQRGGSVEGQLL
jgi:putative SOS response-associated peptidase YedK